MSGHAVRCSNCVHFMALSLDCVAEPPKPAVVPINGELQVIGMFPKTTGDLRCGAFKPDDRLQLN